MKWSDIKRKNRMILYVRRLKRSMTASFKKKVKNTANEYCKYVPEVERKQLMHEMYSFFRKYGAIPDAYEDFRLYGKSKGEIQDYMFPEERVRIFAVGKKNRFPKDKYSRYQLFRDFFHREVIKVDSPADEERYAKFIADKERFMAKPIEGDRGYGVMVVEKEQAPEFSQFMKIFKLPALLEEFIRQGKELAAFHPSSINTVRLLTAINKKNEPVVVYSLFRCGQGKSVVDNVGSGGMIMLIDPNTGRICTDALYQHKYYDKHPDTGLVFQGTQFPEWKSLIDTALRAHRTHKDQVLIGWDFSWTESGWEMVEANPSPSFASWQTLSGTGIRPRLKDLGIL